MRALIQRISNATVEVEATIVGQSGPGLLVLLGVGQGDTMAEAQLLAEKTAHLRIFSDEAGRFDRSLLNVGGSALVVSQFTLYADVRRGRRPSFSAAAAPTDAAPLVDAYAAALRNYGIPVELGVFGATMRVALVNEGPVTIMLDSDTWRQTRHG
ncbi:MAG: D-tyrosyl-tRNA(Tyr) deacylase [Candidatus Viridilinea halotolerans]|uniref:D-aminoacyl-tRNA deacylase n=1 Tax=Candidatus Viridilinea halotolerans TaxID=2491704 RepID=A0A426TXI8_9CHLR|nr:MAG: D-tyrosyl-tRNA(Tyr) deacylase [Candidatus Viridilinea halotolerans]